MASTGALVIRFIGDTKEFDGAVKHVQGSFDGIAKFGAIAGAAAGGAVVAGVVGAMNVESANDKMAAQLGLSAKESERIGGVAGKLYAGAYGDNLEEVNTAVGAVVSSIEGMAGASSKRLEGMSAKALDFATTFDIDVQRAVSSVGTLMKSGLAKDANQAFDLITAASQRVPAHLREDVLDASDEYGQFFSTLGIGGKDAFGMLVDAASKGQFGIDKVGDAIKEFTIRSTDLSKTSKDAYSSIGLDAESMTNKILKGGNSAKGATDKIIRGLLSMKDPGKQAEAAIALFGTPLEDLNVKDIPDFLTSLQSGSDAMDGFGGATKKMGETLNDNATTNLTSFKRQVTTAFVDFVGGKALPIVNDIAGALATGFGPAVSGVTDFLKKHEAIVGPVAVGLGVMAGGIATIIGVIKVWTVVQGILNAVMAMNPIGLVVLALVALAAGLVYAYKKSETFRNIVNGALNGVKAVAQTVGNFFTQKIPAFFQQAWDGAKTKTTDGIAALMGFARAIPGKISGALSSLDSTVAGLFRSAMSAGKEKVIEIAGSIRDWIAGIPDRLASLGSKFATAGRGLLQQFIDGMKNAAGIISGIAGNVWTTVRGLLNGAISSINRALEFRISLPLGKSISINPPDIPHLARGGITTGPTLAVVGDNPGGREAIIPLSGPNAYDFGGGGGRTVIEIRSGGSRLDDLLVEVLRGAIRRQGGDVQVVLGRG